MVKLFGWMRNWNQAILKEKEIRFYGFDAQNPRTGYALLGQYDLARGLATGTELDAILESILAPSYSLSPENTGRVVAFPSRLRKEAGTAGMWDINARDLQMELTIVR